MDFFERQQVALVPCDQVVGFGGQQRPDDRIIIGVGRKVHPLGRNHLRGLFELPYKPTDKHFVFNFGKLFLNYPLEFFDLVLGGHIFKALSL